jgi:hypothetical protein
LREINYYLWRKRRLKLEHFKYPCILTGVEDFSWEESYVLGIFDQEEYVQLKKKRPSYTDHFKLVRLEDIIDDYSFWMSNYR